MEQTLELTDCERSLLQMIDWRDKLAHHLQLMEDEIKIEARRYADETGVTARPTIDQLRYHLRTKATASDCPLSGRAVEQELENPDDGTRASA